MTFTERVAILAHIGWGATLTLGMGLWLNSLLAGLATLVIAIVKESLESIDPTWRLWESEKQPWASSARDVAQFGLGIAAALVLLFVKHAR